MEGYKIEELKLLDLENLVKIANECEIENPREFRRQELIFEILKAQTKKAVLYFYRDFRNFFRRLWLFKRYGL